jgi:DNA-binding CsgD family transcriptional regulator
MPTWMRWVATMMEPRWETRRWTTTGPMAGAGMLAARRAPRSPVPAGGRDGAGQGAQEHAVVADDGHLGAVHPQGAPQLTPRHWEVLHLVAAGHTNSQVARRLGVTEATVRKHLENIYARLHVSSRTAAVTRALPGPGYTESE